ncbi:uncharacterized protein K452DRAFT_230064 [Aplosporella prunicola CBS 121167]|uniref:SMP-30/Gluconolactonase/LRE-like region domain-containing protein n=1 Tax=Aplosporella prunicola CBS 121167 TaxID=1176127 RepID=A0A6A6B8K4_9PEZI|nr:uncharacterized protein K452DRAFT_230064 [Aplosporella prunicola CBS 121167]KAF2140440.1 hypothetical protein K452DRAFT_230064 [Aplosporella prunicola CBS 121167]
MFLSGFLKVGLCLPLLCKGLPVSNGTASTTLPKTSALSTVHQFDYGTWIENVAVRSNGNLLVTLMDRPELYEVDPAKGSASLVHRFDEGFLSLTSLVEVQDDVFAVIAGNFSLSTTSSVDGSYAVFKLDMTASTPAASKIAAIPEGNFLDGITTLDADAGVVLVSDAGTGVVYRLDMATGKYEQVLADDSMKPKDGYPLVLGVDGIRYSNGYLYYVNFPNNQFWRVAIDASTGKATGSYELVASDATGDDFAITSDGTAYVAGNFINSLEKVTADGKVTVLAGGETLSDLAGLTSVAFGRGSADKNSLYVVTSGALANPVNGTFSEGGKIVRVDL